MPGASIAETIRLEGVVTRRAAEGDLPVLAVIKMWRASGDVLLQPFVKLVLLRNMKAGGVFWEQDGDAPGEALKRRSQDRG